MLGLGPRIRGPTSSLAVRKGYSITRLAQTLWTRLSHSSTACTRRAMGNGNGGEQVSETKRIIFGHPKSKDHRLVFALSARIQYSACHCHCSLFPAIIARYRLPLVCFLISWFPDFLPGSLISWFPGQFSRFRLQSSRIERASRITLFVALLLLQRSADVNLRLPHSSWPSWAPGRRPPHRSIHLW